MRQSMWFRGATRVICVLTVLIGTRTSPGGPSIDGFIDDDFWQHAARVWHVNSPDDPGRRATFYLGYDESHLYVAADIFDRDVQGRHVGERSRIWRDDAFVVFLDLGEASAQTRSPRTYAYGFSAAGGMNWTRNVERPVDEADESDIGKRWQDTSKTTLRSAVSLKPGTTANASGDEDRGYEIEVAIPWSELGETPPVLPNRIIGVNFLCFSPPPGSGIDARPLSTTPGITLANHHRPERWQRIRLDWMGPWRTRGVAVELPAFPDDRASPDRTPDPAEDHEEDGPAGVSWLDREAWKARVALLEAHQINRLLLIPHFDGLGRDGFSDKADIDGHAQRKDANAPDDADGDASGRVRSEGSSRSDLAWLIEQAGMAQIDVYLLLNPPAAGTAVPSHDRLVRILQAWPGLRGWVARVGDGGWSVEEIERTVLKVLATAERDDSAPSLMCWSRGVAAEELLRLKAGHPSLGVLLDVQADGQWLKPIVDPAVLVQASAMAAGEAPSAGPWRPAVIGGPGSLHMPLGWYNPQWIWDVAAQVRQYGLDGMFLRVDDRNWEILEETFAAYAVYGGAQYNRGRWVRRLEEIYGIGDYAGQLLEAMEHASAILPLLEHIACGPAERLAPQHGLLLIQYLEWPTYSDYLDQRRLREQGSPWAWPRARWGDPVAGIHAYIDRQAPRMAIRPDVLTNDIGRHVDAVRGLLGNLRDHPPEDREQAARFHRVLDQLELAAQLGRHYHHKLRAAIGWKRYLTGRENHLNCIRGLRESIEAWREVLRVAERLCPDDVAFWQAQPVDEPPWSAAQIERSFRFVRAHWRDQLPRFERELALVQSVVSHGREVARLPLWDHVDARPFSELRPIQQIGFEVPRDNRFELTDAGTLTRESEHVLGEKTSLLADGRQADTDAWHVALMTDTGHCPLPAHRPYQIHFTYRVLAVPNTDEPVFMVGVRPAPGRDHERQTLRFDEVDEVIGDHPAWTAPVGHTGSRVVQTAPLPTGNGQLFIAVRRGAAVVIDQLAIHVVERFVEPSSP